jgi:hydrogenase nickel incorporation protein HypA/HybF
MHELGIIQNIFQTLEEIAVENRLVAITHVKLQIGKLQQIVPEMLTFAFETVAKGTKVEGAQLHVESLPIIMQCQTCQAEFAVDNHVYVCPECSETSLTTLQGTEIILESIEGEQEQ